MNKELIKKYKSEFDHWLNGGRLLSKHINDKDWYEATDPSFSNINVSYVIYDEYVELRKAIIKGKTIQVWDVIYQHLTDPKLDAYDWRDFKSFTQSSPFTYSPERHRVKPEEPQFKIGDWVTVSGPAGEFTEQISSINEDTYTLSRTNICYKSQATPWKPKPSEYIWDKHYGFCKVTTNCVTNEVTTLFNCIDPFNKALEFTVLLEDCQPFIGTLPTNLQD